MDESNALDVAVSIETPLGWLDLQDIDGGYQADASAFADRSVSHRKVEVSSGWMEGSFVTRSVRENISEQLVIQIEADDHQTFDARANALMDALEQISYQIKFSVGLAQQTWQCTVADYSLSTSREFLFATMGILKATVPRLPSAVYETLEEP